MAEIVAINGKIFKPEEARISVFDRGFLFGDGVYEVARSYGRVLFALEEHIDRLFNSSRRIHMDLGRSPQDIINEIYSVYDQANQDDMYMRIIVTRGEGKPNIDPSLDFKPNTVIMVRSLDKIDARHYADGIDIITASVFRNPKKSLDPNIKSGNYLNNVMALGEARAKKAYDAVLTNREGYIVEGTTWNIFMVKDGVCITPPDDSDILQGITRKILKKICFEQNISWQEKLFTPEEFQKADEGFSTGSVKEVMAIRSLDGITIGKNKGPGPLTQKLAKLYKDYVKNYCDSHKR